MADDGTMRRIWRYKSDLEQEPDEEKLLEILGKLKRLPVSISALQETGIGKLVNSFRKRTGAVGELARRVVTSWKSVVEREVTTSKNRSPSPGGTSSGDEDKHEHQSEEDSDADSWNSFKEEDNAQGSSRSRNKTDHQSTRKRQYLTDSDDSVEAASRSSVASKELKHSSFKLDNIKVEPAGDYSPAQKKKCGPESRDLIKNENYSKADAVMKVTSHTISLKTERLKHSSHGEQHSRGLTDDGRSRSSSSTHSVDGQGDRHRGSIKVDRRKKQHSISSDEDDSSRSNQLTVVPSSSSHNHSSSSSHKHSSSSSHNHSSSSSHKHSSSSSHKPSSSSNSHKLSSSNSHKPSSSSNSHKPSSSSSNSHKPSSSSNSHKPSSSSNSHKPSSSSNSQQPSSSNSYKLSSSSLKPSSSSSSSSSSHKTSNSHEPSTSSSHKQSSSSSSHKLSSSSKCSNRGTSPSLLHNGPSPPPCEQQKSAPEAVISRGKSNSGHRHDADTHASHDKAHPSYGKEVDQGLSPSKKRHSSSSRDKSSIHSNNNSCKKENSSEKHSTLNRDSGKVKLESADGSSSLFSPDKSGFRVSSSTVHIKEEHQADTRDHHASPSPSLPSSKTSEAKDKSYTKIKLSSSGHKKGKPKSCYENPELDLFSEALHIKTEPSSPVHRSKSLKQTPSKPSQTVQSASPTLDAQPHHVSADFKVKSEFSSVSEHTLGDSLKDVVKQEKEDDSDSQGCQSKKSKEDKNKAVKEEPRILDEIKMSFEDFMTFDEVALVSKGKSSQKSTSKSSSSRSSKGSHKQADKQSGSKWSSSLSDLPGSSKTSFSVPAPANNVKVTELDILSTLPETQASYRPLRFNPYYRDEEEREPSPPPLVDPDMIGTKNVSRTHVYSGRKHGITEVKSLYDLCMKVLIDNIDAIDCVGGTPYSILKPVLERCSAQQLYQLEDYNPHFLEDSDELWQNLCLRDFKGSKPQELESWRELYLRQFEERELKYQRLKQSMSSSITKGQAGRKAQLAYVDTVAKPPREVLRKQKQFGTGCIARAKNNPAMTGSGSGLRAYKPSMLVPAYNPMDDRARMVRPLPPMMAKSMQMRKNMRR